MDGVGSDVDYRDLCHIVILYYQLLIIDTALDS
jgi:hypothetical protein